jgi:Histidine kinase
MLERVLYLASLVTFGFGALTFSALTLAYVRQGGARRRAGSILPAFTAVCAVSFVVNLALEIAVAADAAPGWTFGLDFALDLSTSLLAPAIFHLIYAPEAKDLARWWRWVVFLFYPASLAVAAIKGFWSPDWLGLAPAAGLGVAAGLGLAAQTASRREMAGLDRVHRRWTRSLLLALLAFSIAYVARPDLPVALLPDYLVLALFAVTLYFEERLLFFDLLIKRGVMFAMALGSLTAIVTVVRPIAGKANLDEPWMVALLVAPLFLLAPRISRWLDRVIDRAWLDRRYSMDEAERKFSDDIHQASTAADLRRGAAASLAEIFQAPVEVDFESAGPREKAEMSAVFDPGGISVLARRDGVPFLSDDHRLLRSCARALGSALHSLRLREREHELRLLATRAELKALRAQINPHFLFNALNAIAGLIEEDPRRADETVERLAQVFRYALRKPESEWVTVAEELAFVEAYLGVEQARFGSRLRVEIEADPAAAALPIPAVTVQPIVENAIKHGVSSMDGAWNVSIRARVDGGGLSIEVADNGAGFPPGYSIGESGHGLRNVADRLAGYYDGAARLTWSSARGETRVRLEMPCAS